VSGRRRTAATARTGWCRLVGHGRRDRFGALPDRLFWYRSSRWGGMPCLHKPLHVIVSPNGLSTVIELMKLATYMMTGWLAYVLASGRNASVACWWMRSLSSAHGHGGGSCGNRPELSLPLARIS